MDVAYIQVTSPAGQKRVTLDGGPLTIGRNFTNLVVVDEVRASRFHCVIEESKEGYRVRDLESRNGTLLNGQLVRESVMQDGDAITIGETELRLFVPNKAKKSAAPEMEELNDLASIFDEEEPHRIEAAAAAPRAKPRPKNEPEWERTLRDRAEALSDRNFDEEAIDLYNARGKVAHSGEKTKDTPEILTLMRLIILICIRSRATDIHIEPKNDDMQVRLRVDGSLVDIVHLTKETGIKLLSMVKVLSDIDIAQRNNVQEGHFSSRVPPPPAANEASQNLTVGEHRIDYRVSFAPSMHGQKLVIRILDAANAPMHVNDLQMPTKARQVVRRIAEQDAGMILVCGPTGSGKTTTLYSVLRDIDSTQRNVVTIEDPVEIQLEGVTQIPVNEAQGNTFSVLLRSLLRQDPDVILVGEIRDAETSRVAVQAAMTGHLVFSTVHSRDAVSGMFRLLDLGCEPYLVASGVQLVIAQRLIRQLCPHCKVGRVPTAEQNRRMTEAGFPGVKKIYDAKGCRKCFNTGYFGRRGIYEMLVATPALREVLLRGPSQEQCIAALTPNSYLTLAESGYRLLAEGVVSMDEMERTVS